jgi:isopenicillin-N N-acyltransferase-like protein
MGRQHGEIARPLVRKYLAWIEKLTGKSLSKLCQNALRFEHELARLSGAYVEEVRGLAEGAAISFAEALLCQVRAEACYALEGGCTAFALKGPATADGEPLLGQNQDMNVEFSDVAILLRVCPSDSRPRALMFTFAGQLGYSGMNSLGLAHFNNALYGCEWRPGIPHYPLKRLLLQCPTIDDAIVLARNHPVCSAANLVLGDKTGAIADLEVRPDGVEIYDDLHHAIRIHTNHYLAPRFQRHETGYVSDSCGRLERMRTLVKKAWGSITVDTMKEFLADHEGDPAGICRHGAQGWHSISGYIAEPTRGLLHVRRGHGCLGTWAAYRV